MHFTIKNLRNEQKVVHHDLLVPVINNEIVNKPQKINLPDDFENEASSSANSEYTYSFESESIINCDNDENDQEERNVLPRNRPRRQRQLRILPATIPGNVLKI